MSEDEETDAQIRAGMRRLEIERSSKNELSSLRKLAEEATAHDKALVAGMRAEIERLTAERDEALNCLRGGTYVPREWVPNIVQRLEAERDEWKAAAQEACDENNRLRETIFKAKAELAADHPITAAHILELAGVHNHTETLPAGGQSHAEVNRGADETDERLTVVGETGLVRETFVLEFLGYLSGDITELHHVEVPRLKDSWERYKAIVEAAARDGAYL